MGKGRKGWDGVTRWVGSGRVGRVVGGLGF